MLSRAEQSFFSDWWWTVDRWLIAGLCTLMVMGVVFTMAGSPPVAERLSLPTFHFVNRHLGYLVPASLIMVGVSLLTPRGVRRVALIGFTLGMLGVLAAIQFGVKIKGARRWVFGLQPAEFVKPCFVILAAWAFSEGARRRDVPGTAFALLLLPATIIPFMLQPDFGQTVLVSIVWGGLFFLAGLHILWVAGIGTLGVAGGYFAYKFLPHVRVRFDKFLNAGNDTASTNPGNSFQSDVSVDSFVQGGWLGKGPGEGTLKRILPDSHTDFIFAVTGEEFGVLVAFLLMSVFAFIVLRGFLLAMRNEDPFCRFAAAGLIMLFGLQSAINMGVNLHLLPAKGMTLPFISYGGSSMLSLAIGMGFLIAVTRRRPRSAIIERVA
jgi:cell division protein FtsW